MTQEAIFSGFGGQGVLTIGKFIAKAGMKEGKNVSWLPSYGPEMRGGTANVTVIISDERISSPILNSYDTAIILNQQSMDKFEKTVKPGGLLIYDPNGITRLPVRKDINIYSIEAADEAGKRGLSKIFNMIVLGGFLKLKPLVAPEYIRKGLEKSLPARHHALIPENEKAIGIGKELLTPIHVLN